MNVWPDVKNGMICGECYALININSYGTCRAYCESIGLACLNAFEESGDSCTIKSNENCDTDFDWTSDALCQCTSDTGSTYITNSRLKPRFPQIIHIRIYLYNIYFLFIFKAITTIIIPTTIIMITTMKVRLKNI